MDLRATYGYSGNLDRSVTGVTTLQFNSNAQYTNLPYSIISNIGNPDLRWEKTAIAKVNLPGSWWADVFFYGQTKVTYGNYINLPFSTTSVSGGRKVLNGKGNLSLSINDFFYGNNPKRPTIW